MKISDRGVALIKAFESFEPRVYLDPVGVETVGYGTTRPEAIEKYRRTGISEQQASEELVSDCARFERAVEQLVHVPLTQNQFDALVSFVYNVGEGAFGNSTLLHSLNLWYYNHAANLLLDWVHGDGRVLPGLVTRRMVERKLFLEGWPSIVSSDREVPSMFIVISGGVGFLYDGAREAGRRHIVLGSAALKDALVKAGVPIVEGDIADLEGGAAFFEELTK